MRSGRGPPTDVGERPQRRLSARGAWLRSNERNGDGGIREELAEEVTMTTRVIMLMMATCLSMTAEAEAADETLPLACQGTVTETMMEEEKKPVPISMGIIVNFTNSTVKGFGNPDPNEDFPIKITEVNEATISFRVRGLITRKQPPIGRSKAPSTA